MVLGPEIGGCLVQRLVVSALELGVTGPEIRGIGLEIGECRVQRLGSVWSRAWGLRVRSLGCWV